MALGLLAVAGPAGTANEFTINACQADRGEFSTQAFEDFANRGMMWKRACDPGGRGCADSSPRTSCAPGAWCAGRARTS